MYLYFDKTGTLKEIINNEAIRQGNQNYNKVYCYFETGIDFSAGLFWKLKYPNGTESNDVSFLGTQYEENGQVPYNKDVDYKYFKDFVTYKFHVFNLTTYLSQDGLYKLTITAYPTQSTANVLGTVTFNAESSVIESDPQLTQSQYNYLLGLIGQWVSSIDSKVDKQTSNGKGIITNNNDGTKIQRTETTSSDTYVSRTDYLGGDISSLAQKNEDELSRILQYFNSIVFSIQNTSQNKEFLVAINGNSFSIIDTTYSDETPIFKVDNTGTYFKGSKLLVNVNTANIVDKAVTKAKLSQELQDFLDELIVSIPDGSVTTQKIVDGAVTKDKLASALATQIDGAGRKLALEIDTDFKIVAKLYDKDDNLISTSNAIDLPLESVVVSGAYDSQTQKVVLTLQDGSTIEFSVADLVSGLQPEITSSNKLAVNLVAFSQAQLDALNSGITAAKVSGYDSHLSNTSNPHSVTKAQVGLGNVDNTSDANKPVSTAQQAALNLKEDKANKVTSVSSSSTDDKYPSAKATYDAIQNYGGAVGVAKALYHLGAFDSADGKTRQTWQVDLSKLSWSNDGTNSIFISNYATDLPMVLNTTRPTTQVICSTYTYAKGETVYATAGTYYINDRYGDAGQRICVNTGSASIKPTGILQYILQSSYTDTPIENQSILPLDTNMANKIRQKVVDGLNLFTNVIGRAGGFYNNNKVWNSNSSYNAYVMYLKAGTYSYTCDGYYYGSSFICDASLTPTHTLVGLGDNSAGTGQVKHFTLTEDSYILWCVNAGAVNKRLNEGNHAYPYSDFNQKEHITNEQAELLKDLEQTLLWTNNNPSSDMADDTQLQLSQTFNNFKYIIIEYKISPSFSSTKPYKIGAAAGETIFITEIGMNSGQIVTMGRGFEFSAADTTKIITKNCYNSISSALATLSVIPVRIYGTNTI